jgi:hypothetical protein
MQIAPTIGTFLEGGNVFRAAWRYGLKVESILCSGRQYESKFKFPSTTSAWSALNSAIITNYKSPPYVIFLHYPFLITGSQWPGSEPAQHYFRVCPWSGWAWPSMAASGSGPHGSGLLDSKSHKLNDLFSSHPLYSPLLFLSFLLSSFPSLVFLLSTYYKWVQVSTSEYSTAKLKAIAHVPPNQLYPPSPLTLLLFF